jgi:hypothetical protein
VSGVTAALKRKGNFQHFFLSHVSLLLSVYSYYRLVDAFRSQGFDILHFETDVYCDEYHLLGCDVMQFGINLAGKFFPHCMVSPLSCTLKMEATYSSQIAVNFCWRTWQHI